MAGDDPVHLRWFKDGLPLVSSSKFMINSVASKMSLLILPGVGSEHTGTYTCKAVNEVGEAEISATLKVKGNTLIIILCLVFSTTDLLCLSPFYLLFCLINSVACIEL